MYGAITRYMLDRKKKMVTGSVARIPGAQSGKRVERVR